jgi:hypothetical protein
MAVMGVIGSVAALYPHAPIAASHPDYHDCRSDATPIAAHCCSAPIAIAALPRPPLSPRTWNAEAKRTHNISRAGEAVARSSKSA